MFKTTFSSFNAAALFDGTLLTLELSRKTLVVVGAGIFVLLCIGILQEKGVDTRDSLNKKSLPVR